MPVPTISSVVDVNSQLYHFTPTTADGNKVIKTFYCSVSFFNHFFTNIEVIYLVYVKLTKSESSPSHDKSVVFVERKGL